MADRNWGLIGSGGTFQGLAATLLCFEDHKANLFGRPGPDGGQDMRSGDGKTVYQAKFNCDRSAAKALSDAKAEAAKIQKYREPEHPRHAQWKGVERWCLVTNADFNPSDEQRWRDEVVPAFARIGLTAEHWLRAKLDALLEKHPEVHRSYFGGQVRVFLTLPEAWERFEQESPGLLRAARASFQGRDGDLQACREFLASEKSFLLVHGSGGVGKTRFILEAGEESARTQGWQVLWANIASMQTGSWFDAMVPERPTFLLVDDPEDSRVLEVLLEQLVSRAKHWKVAVAVRSSVEPVLRFLDGPRVTRQVEKRELKPLEPAVTQAFCLGLLDSGALKDQPQPWKAEIAQKLVRYYGGYPVWISMAIELLEQGKPPAAELESSDKLADSYLEELYRPLSFRSEQIWDAVRGIALLGTVSRQDELALSLLAKIAGWEDRSQLLSCLEQLVNRGLLARKGAWDRLVEIKPDVLRDHVLRRWLYVKEGFGDSPWQPSKAAKDLARGVAEAVKVGAMPPAAQAVLRSLARTEYLLCAATDATPGLLDLFFEQLLAAVDAMPATARITAAGAVVDIAEMRPREVVSLSRRLRTSPCTSDSIEGWLGPREVGHDEVVLELAWPVLHAAQGARLPQERREVLTELCDLVEAEERVRLTSGKPLPNDGKRAADLLQRVIEGGPQYWASFDEEARELGLLRLSDAEIEKLAEPARRAAVMKLLETATAVDRDQTYTEGNTFIIQNCVVLPGQPAWDCRSQLLARMKALLEAGVDPPELAEALWGVAGRAHHSLVNGLSRVADGEKPGLRAEILGDLEWVAALLARRKLEFRELATARELWQWHSRFEPDAEIKSIASFLEDQYQQNELSQEFEPLAGHGTYKKHPDAARRKAEVLVRAKDPGAISRFLDRATRYFKDTERVVQVFGVGTCLGDLAPVSESVRAFVRDALRRNGEELQARFASVITRLWVASVRKEAAVPEAARLMADLGKIPPDSVSRACLYWQVYSRYMPDILGPISVEEHAFLRSTERIFLDAKRAWLFFDVFGWSFSHDWNAYKSIAERVLEAMPREQLRGAAQRLVEAVWLGLDRGLAGDESLLAELGVWLLNQVLRLPEVGDLGGEMEWQLQEILKVARRPGISWLVDAVNRRRRLEQEAGDDPGVRSLPTRNRLSSYVERVTEASANRTDVVEALRQLLTFVLDDGLIGYVIPEYVHDVDPEGLIAPHLVAECIEAVAETPTAAAQARRWARVGGVYPLLSTPWRTIAKPACRAAERMDEADQNSLFAALTDRHRPRVLWGRPDVSSERVKERIAEAQKLVDQEQAEDIRRFLEWNVKVVEAKLKREAEWAKEEPE